MSRLDHHVAAVQRKLAARIFVDWLCMSALVGAVLALLTIISYKLLPITVPLTLLWVGLGAILGVALLMTILNRPSPALAAVAIDEKLQLKEKFSSALEVRRRLDDPFAQAVVRDAEDTAQRVRLAGHFPLEMPRSGYWTIGVAVIAGLALMLPRFELFREDPAVEARRIEQLKSAEEAQRIVREAKLTLETRVPATLHDLPEIKLARNMLENELRQPNTDRERAARRVAEAMALAKEGLRKHAENTAAFNNAQQNQRQMGSGQPPGEGMGPVADAHRKIVQGEFDKAMEELDKLAREWDKMDRKDQEKAAEQMKDLANALQRMAQDPRAMEKLQEQLKQAGADQQQTQQIQRLMQLAAAGNQQAQQQLQQMAKQLAQQMQQAGMSQQQIQAMQQAMQAAQQAAGAQQAAAQMAQAAQQMAQAMAQAAQGQQPGGNSGQGQGMDPQAMQNMLDQMRALADDARNAQALREAQQALDEALAGACQGLCEGDGQGEQQGAGQGRWAAGDPEGRRGAGQGGPGIGAGGNTGKSVAPYQSRSELSRSNLREDGKFLASTFVKDGGIRGESTIRLKEVLTATEAAAGEDVDDSRPDPRRQTVQRNYFRTLTDEIIKAGG
jgi:hypothetical protein